MRNNECMELDVGDSRSIIWTDQSFEQIPSQVCLGFQQSQVNERGWRINPASKPRSKCR